MAAYWIAAAVSVATIIASLRWAFVHRWHPGRMWADLAIALVALIILGFVIYGMLAFCEAPPGSGCA
jgi:hypothetical protein